jgi:hypothetical protein
MKRKRKAPMKRERKAPMKRMAPRIDSEEDEEERERANEIEVKKMERTLNNLIDYYRKE